MSRLVTAYDHQISDHRFRVPDSLPASPRSSRSLAATLRLLRRKLRRSAFSLSRSVLPRKWRPEAASPAGQAPVYGSGFHKSLSNEEEHDLPAPAAEHAAQKALVALVGPNGAWSSLGLITRAASAQEMDFIEFQDLGELVRFLKDGNSCDLVLVDWDSVSGEAADMKQGGTAALPPANLVAAASSQEVLSLAAAAGEASPGETAKDETSGAEQASRALQLGALTLDFRTGSATWKGHRLDLTVTQFNIVHLFARHAGENLTYRQIYDVVHKPGFHAGDGEDGYQTNVRSLIKRVRQQFKAVDEDFAEIENHRGVGYRWRSLESAEAACEAPESDKDREPSRWTKFTNAVGRTRPAQVAPSASDAAALNMDGSGNR